MKQDDLRKSLTSFVENYGVKYNFIAKEIGISKGYLSLFMNGKRYLAEETAQRLKRFINSRSVN